MTIDITAPFLLHNEQLHLKTFSKFSGTFISASIAPQWHFNFFINFKLFRCFFIFYFANDFHSALILNFILGVAAGGIYGPSMILVSEKFSQGEKVLPWVWCLEGNLLGMHCHYLSLFTFSNFYNFCSLSLTLLKTKFNKKIRFIWWSPWKN